MKKHLIILLLPLFYLVSCQEKQDWPYPSPFFGFAVDGFPITEQDLLALQDDTKIAPEMLLFYLSWPAPSDPHVSILSSINAIWDVGAVPCMTWEPFTIIDRKETTISYKEILNGHYDDYLSVMAHEIKLWGKPLIIRFAHEMNLSRYHWGTTKEDFGPHSPEIYVSMFRYVVDYFKKQKVQNILWAFCPNTDSIPNEAWNAASKYYPGDQYVDIMGMDGYNWDISSALATARNQNWESPWRTFEQIFQPLYRELKKINPYKPMIIFETASVERPEGQKKSLWIQEALITAKSWGIKGVIWFQVNKEENWKVNQNEDYSYTRLIQPTNPPFQTWLLHFPEF